MDPNRGRSCQYVDDSTEHVLKDSLVQDPRPKGFAYLEFQNDSAVENAMKLDGSTFKERQLKVTPKRVNDPNFYGMCVLMCGRLCLSIVCFE